MKAFIKASICLTIILSIAFNVEAQNVTKDSAGTYRALPAEVATKDVYIGIDGVTCPVFETRQGKPFIKRISKKTGKEYRFFLKPEVK